MQSFASSSAQKPQRELAPRLPGDQLAWRAAVFPFGLRARRSLTRPNSDRVMGDKKARGDKVGGSCRYSSDKVRFESI